MKLTFKDYLISSGTGITNISLKFCIDDVKTWYIGSWLLKKRIGIVRIYSAKKYITNQTDGLIEIMHYQLPSDITPNKTLLISMCSDFAKIKYLIERGKDESITIVDKSGTGGSVTDTDIPARGIMYVYKGSVNTYSDLPGVGYVTPGDVYNIVQSDPAHNINAGDNVAWTGSEWDNFAGGTDETISDADINKLFQ